MAERSTAAVDVANESGRPPLSAGAGGATVDGAAQSGTQDSRRTDPEEPPATPSVSGAPELHSGHKLAGRYRLEECVTRADAFSSWRAVDEKLRRAVGVHILPRDHPRARRVLAAARSAALLGDPRFVQVLDAVEEDDLVYVVHEWLPDATELTPLLAAGPLEPHEAYQLVSQVTQAMAVAHREGLSHLRLNPSSVLRTEAGQYRIRGLAVAAALRGIESDRPKREDTEAIGALLYAALTKRWPYPEGAYGLDGLPKDLGLVAPEQVRAGVHRGLSDLAMRALVNDGATPSRQEPPCTTPEELAKAVGAIPRIRPPEPDVPTFPQNGYRQPPARPTQPGAARTAPPVQAPPPALPGRTGKALKWGVAALLIAALGLGSWQVADTLMSHGNTSSNTGTSPQEQKGANAGIAQQSGARPVAIRGASEFAPAGTGIQEDQVPNAIDGRLGTAWITPQYRGYANFGNLPERKAGSGIIVDLGSVQQVTAVVVNLYRAGQTVEVLAAPSGAASPSRLSDFSQRISQQAQAGSLLQATAPYPIKTRYVLIHITALPTDGSSDTYRGGISEIKVFGP